MSARFTLSLALLASTAAACSGLLGLAQPQEQIDAGSAQPVDGHPIDSAVDAAPVHPTIHVVTGGTAQSFGTITSDPAGISCPGTCDFTFDPGTAVTLTATDGSGGFSVFPGFFGGGCTGSAGPRLTCAITPTTDVTVYARYWGPQNIIFTSSTLQTPGSFDTVGNADLLCNQLAGSAGLPGQYVSYLSTNERIAALRVQDANQTTTVATWLRPDGRLFTADVLTDGKIAFPARLDEFGSDVGDDALAVTGTLTGTGSASGSHCSDWASESTTNGLVFAGEPGGGFNRWTQLQGIDCNVPAHIYCVGANSHTLFAQLGPSPIIIFQSNVVFRGDAGLTAMDNECKAEAMAAGFTGARPQTLALVTAGAGKTVQSRFGDFVLSGTVTRPDGVELAPSMDALFAGSAFESAPDQLASTADEDSDVWIGAGGFNSTAVDCSGWTDATPASLGASRPSGTTRASTFFNQVSCGESHNILCAAFVAAEALH